MKLKGDLSNLIKWNTYIIKNDNHPLLFTEKINALVLNDFIIILSHMRPLLACYELTQQRCDENIRCHFPLMSLRRAYLGSPQVPPLMKATADEFNSFELI